MDTRYILPDGAPVADFVIISGKFKISSEGESLSFLRTILNSVSNVLPCERQFTNILKRGGYIYNSSTFLRFPRLPYV